MPTDERAGITAAAAHRRPSRERRRVLRLLREQVRAGNYEPPVEALAGELANWILRNGLPDPELAGR